ncbi:hypothetical protein ID866_12254 [Astraeus odoratus]|nr:hypothetical protein ID866_12254 [Astraeus odoratus]
MICGPRTLSLTWGRGATYRGSIKVLSSIGLSRYGWRQIRWRVGSTGLRQSSRFNPCSLTKLSWSMANRSFSFSACSRLTGLS